MKQPITGYHTDHEDHWVAELACGHFQHVRHSPPLSTRLWTQTEQGRRSMLGFQLNCVKCDEGAPPAQLAKETECDLETSVPDWLIDHPALLSLFQTLGIDYCCGGKSLEFACRQQNLDPANVLQQIHQRLA